MNHIRKLLVAPLLLSCTLTASVHAQYSLTVLAKFNGANGSDPANGLVRDASGNLYGCTENGGANGYGNVYMLPAGSNSPTTLFTFNGTNGYNPGSLIIDASGNLYGTTQGANGSTPGTSINYGVVFKIANNASHTFSTVATFSTGGANGESPTDLVMDAGGNIYGTTADRGPNLGGTVFKIAAGSQTISTLATFTGTFGSNLGHNPSNYAHGLVVDANGNLFGTTIFDGATDVALGTVFEVANDPNHTLSTLVSFDGSNGRNPHGRLLLDANGNLYGVTYQGGANDLGTVFKVANDASHTLTTLVTFDGTNGSMPLGGLISDAAGNLYGTTVIGGSGDGTIFELAAGTYDLATMAIFDGTNAARPAAALIADANGNLYSTTQNGGVNNNGSIFELSPVPEPSTLALLGCSLAVVSLVTLSRCCTDTSSNHTSDN